MHESPFIKPDWQFTSKLFLIKHLYRDLNIILIIILLLITWIKIVFNILFIDVCLFFKFLFNFIGHPWFILKSTDKSYLDKSLKRYSEYFLLESQSGCKDFVKYISLPIPRKETFTYTAYVSIFVIPHSLFRWLREFRS